MLDKLKGMADKSYCYSLKKRVKWAVDEIERLTAERDRYKSALDYIGRIASGEDQVADDDTEGMAYIAVLAAEAVRP